MSKEHQEASAWSGVSDERVKRGVVIEITGGQNMSSLIGNFKDFYCE